MHESQGTSTRSGSPLTRGAAWLVLGVWYGAIALIVVNLALACVGSVLLVVGYVFEATGIENAGHEMWGVVWGSLRLVAIVATPLLAMYASGFTLYTVTQCLRYPVGLLMALFTFAGLGLCVVSILSMVEAFEWVLGGVLGLGIVGGIAGVLVQQAGMKGIEAGVEWLEPGQIFGLLLGVLCLWGIVAWLCHWLGWITIWGGST